jgi:hypothetical protein
MCVCGPIGSKFLDLTNRTNRATRFRRLAFFLDSSTVEMEAIRSFETSENTNFACTVSHPKGPPSATTLLRKLLISHDSNMSAQQKQCLCLALALCVIARVCTRGVRHHVLFTGNHLSPSQRQLYYYVIAIINRPPPPPPVTPMLTLTPSSESMKSQIMVYW